MENLNRIENEIEVATRKRMLGILQGDMELAEAGERELGKLRKELEELQEAQ